MTRDGKRADGRGGSIVARKNTRDATSRAPWPVAKRVIGEFFADSIPTVAGGVTFFILLALFPAVGSLVSLYGLVADRHDVAQNLEEIAIFLPEGGMMVLGAELKRLT